MKNIREEVCRVIKSCYQRGLITALEGNVSARIIGEEKIWITPHGVDKETLTPNEMVCLDLGGRVLEGRLEPSMEWPFHVAIYKSRKGVNGIVHSHNPITLGLAAAGFKMKAITVGLASLGEINIAPFSPPGTRFLRESVIRNLGENRALILQNHGVIAVGRSLTEAKAVVEVLEEASKTLLTAHQLTKKPKLITPESIKSLEHAS